MRTLLFLLCISLVFPQFKSEMEKQMESILMAPCCGGGTLAEHSDNTMTLNIKAILRALTTEEYDKQHILDLFELAYKTQNMMNAHFSPQTKQPDQVLAHVSEVVHPSMTADEIADLFVWIHTDRIRSAPEESGVGGLLAWNTPAAILLAGIILMTLVVQRFVRRNKLTVPVAGHPKLDSALEERIEKEMKDLKI